MGYLRVNINQVGVGERSVFYASKENAFTGKYGSVNIHETGIKNGSGVVDHAVVTKLGTIRRTNDMESALIVQNISGANICSVEILSISPMTFVNQSNRHGAFVGNAFFSIANEFSQNSISKGRRDGIIVVFVGVFPGCPDFVDKT